MSELLKDVLQALKVFAYGLLLLAYSAFVKAKKWLLALLGMVLMLGCTLPHRPFPVHGIMAMDVECPRHEACEEFAHNSCWYGTYHVFAQGEYRLVFACTNPDNTQSHVVAAPAR
jgi:hypothetical protein